jgi:hypothetical protein
LNQDDSNWCVGAVQASHLLLIRINLGYGTVITVACAHQGCDASGLVWFGLVWFGFVTGPQYNSSIAMSYFLTYKEGP